MHLVAGRYSDSTKSGLSLPLSGSMSVTPVSLVSGCREKGGERALLSLCPHPYPASKVREHMGFEGTQSGFKSLCHPPPTPSCVSLSNFISLSFLPFQNPPADPGMGRAEPGLTEKWELRNLTLRRGCTTSCAIPPPAPSCQSSLLWMFSQISLRKPG